jgi:hypothetical protein
MRMLGAFGMAAKYKTEVKVGYDLAAEVLYYIADKLSSTRNDDNDDQLKVKSELVKQGLDVHIEEWRDNARRLREIHQRSDTQLPPSGSRERERAILAMEEEDNFVNSITGLVCFALGVYGYDLFQARGDIARQVVIRKPSPEYLQAFLRMDEVERQLGIIQVAMKKDWCGK